MRPAWLFVASAIVAAAAARFALDRWGPVASSRPAASTSRYIRDKPKAQGTIDLIPPELAEPETQADRARALQLDIAGDIAGAEKLLREILVRYPNSSLTYLALCPILQEQKRYDELDAAAHRAFELEPRSADAAAAVALAAAWKGDHPAAIAWDTRALGLDPNDGSVYFNRGMERLQLEQYRSAIEDLARVPALMPGSQYSATAVRKIDEARERLAGHASEQNPGIESAAGHGPN